jgi:hypothetical protein
MTQPNHFEISGRFREVVEARIERLELDAAQDALTLPQLTDPAHIERHRLLITAQIDEAIRLRARLTFSDSPFESIPGVARILA